MADNRTMAQMLQAPIEGYEDAIVVPPINANNFELKQPLINLVQSNKFTGRQDPHNHLRFFNKVTSTFRHPEVPNTSIKLLLFPFSLDGEARDWLDKEPPRSILTWDDLVLKFIAHYRIDLMDKQIDKRIIQGIDEKLLRDTVNMLINTPISTGKIVKADFIQNDDKLRVKTILLRTYEYDDAIHLPNHRELSIAHETRSGSTTTHANYSLPEYDSFLFEIKPDQGGLTSVVIADNSNDILLEIPEFESFHFDPLFPRPPPEPPDVEKCFEPEAALDEDFSSKNYFRRFLRALHPKWRAKVTTIKESKDLSSLALDELIDSLKVHEVVMEKDFEIYKGKKERIKSIALKAKKESSDDETLTSGSDDE
ncbi:hypothetical protein Tco_0020025 [Tanacetum coccineum]